MQASSGWWKGSTGSFWARKVRGFDGFHVQGIIGMRCRDWGFVRAGLRVWERVWGLGVGLRRPHSQSHVGAGIWEFPKIRVPEYGVLKNKDPTI